jgi:hypothetical protein
MKKLTATMFIVFVWISSHAHEFKMGMFEFYQTKNGYQLDMKFDKVDLLTGIRVNFSEYSSETSSLQFESYVSDYINSNLGITINQTCIEFTIDTVEFEDDFIVVYADLNYTIDNIEEITIYNTCLLDVVDGHSNVMNFLIKDRRRTFRLDEDRVRTIVSYN